MDANETDKVAAKVSSQILECENSIDYTTLLKTFYHAKLTTIKKRRKQVERHTHKSPTMQNLELRFSKAIATLQREKT